MYESIIVDIVGRRMSLRFEITSGKVFLRDRNEPELAHLVNKPMEPAELLLKLQKSGINFLPCNDDAKTCGITLKSEASEHKAIEDISYASRKYYVASSKWNSHMPFNQIVARLKYNPLCDEEFLEDQEKDWMSTSWWENKCEI